MTKLPPLSVKHLFPLLDQKLMELLRSLGPDEWQLQTVAKAWKVKDVAAHLLDGNIRILSIQRDKYFGEVPPPEAVSYSGLVHWLNELNADWVKAARRISPGILILLHEATGKAVSDHFISLDPMDTAIFPVAWAGENESLNWMHIAREYTEKWLHQQQIRDAVNKPGIMTKELFQPFIQAFMHGLPHAFRDTDAPEGTAVRLTVDPSIGNSCTIIRQNEGWNLFQSEPGPVTAEVIMDADTAWKLFSKSLRPQDVIHKLVINGDAALANTVLSMVAVMA
ncbi:MAG TPA: maleylpyruvate isomerase N-terminal domain-containing protein [Flavisolibacter sp.]|nr:maleylpyruvate isomerase N-terminal domain-containing protein [Flavisolibacter sp.]